MKKSDAHIKSQYELRPPCKSCYGSGLIGMSDTEKICPSCKGTRKKMTAQDYLDFINKDRVTLATIAMVETDEYGYYYIKES